MRVAVPPRVAATYLAVTIAVAGVGWWLGSTGQRQRARPPTAGAAPPDSSTLRRWHDWYDSLAQAFYREVTGITVGAPFPRLLISPFDEDSILTIPEVLPAGGVVALLTADCDKCVQTAAALQAALDSAAITALPTVLLADGLEGALPFAAELARRGVRIPLFCDRESTLRTRHNVHGTMPWFRLDAQSRLISYGFVFEPNVAKLREIVSEDGAPGAIQGDLQM